MNVAPPSLLQGSLLWEIITSQTLLCAVLTVSLATKMSLVASIPFPSCTNCSHFSMASLLINGVVGLV